MRTPEAGAWHQATHFGKHLNELLEFVGNRSIAKWIVTTKIELAIAWIYGNGIATAIYIVRNDDESVHVRKRFGIIECV